MFNSSWVPNEDPQTLLAERCWLQGVIVAAITYGINLALHFLSFRLLLCGSDNTRIELKKRLPLILPVYLIISFLLSTLHVISLAAFTQMTFINNRDYPGGPSAFENVFFSVPADNPANIAFVLSNWLSDALVVWRFKVIYQPMCRVSLWKVMLFPCLMLAGSVALGIMFLIEVSITAPRAFVDAKLIRFTPPYLGLSLALNVTLTTAIVLRLLLFRYRIVSSYGPEHGTHYTSIAAMIIESAALYSAMSITSLVLLGVSNPVAHVVAQSLNQFQTTATLLIVFRVAQRTAWTGETASQLMIARETNTSELNTVQFPSPQPGTSVPLADSQAGAVVDRCSDICNDMVAAHHGHSSPHV